MATVLLPNNSPVREVTGRLQMRRQLARASACLEACKLLHQVSETAVLWGAHVAQQIQKRETGGLQAAAQGWRMCR